MEEIVAGVATEVVEITAEGAEGGGELPLKLAELMLVGHMSVKFTMIACI